MFFDRDADIAALWLTPEEARSVGTFIYEVPEWPPPPPVPGEMVFIAGFPLEGRISLTPKRFEFRSMNLSTPVTSVADLNFKCQFERSEWVSLSKVAPHGAPGSLDGLSGAPIMAMRGLRPIVLGTVSEHQPALHILVAGR